MKDDGAHSRAALRVTMWCMERRRPDGGTELDLTTLALTEALALQIADEHDQLLRADYVGQHMMIRARRVKIETED